MKTSAVTAIAIGMTIKRGAVWIVHDGPEGVGVARRLSGAPYSRASLPSTTPSRAPAIFFGAGALPAWTPSPREPLELEPRGADTEHPRVVRGEDRAEDHAGDHRSEEERHVVRLDAPLERDQHDHRAAPGQERQAAPGLGAIRCHEVGRGALADKNGARRGKSVSPGDHNLHAARGRRSGVASPRPRELQLGVEEASGVPFPRGDVDPRVGLLREDCVRRAHSGEDRRRLGVDVLRSGRRLATTRAGVASWRLSRQEAFVSGAGRRAPDPHVTRAGRGEPTAARAPTGSREACKDSRMSRSSLLWALVASLGCSCSSTTGNHVLPDSGGPGRDASPTARDAGRDGGDASRFTGDAGSPGLGGGDVCTGPCCPEPSPGEACSNADAGSCKASVQCAAGLLLPVNVACVGGAWTTPATCEADGGVASNGCPQAQPVNGTSCSLPAATTYCQYVLVCPSACDAGGSVLVPVDGGAASGTGCVGAAGKVGPAFCKAGIWQTQVLGSCH